MPSGGACCACALALPMCTAARLPAQVVKEGRRNFDGSMSSALGAVATMKQIINDPQLALHKLAQPPPPRPPPASADVARPTNPFFTPPTEESGPTTAPALPSSGDRASNESRPPIDPTSALELSGKLQVLVALLVEVRRTTEDRFVVRERHSNRQR